RPTSGRRLAASPKFPFGLFWRLELPGENESATATVRAQTLDHKGNQLLGDDQITGGVPKTLRVVFPVELVGQLQTLRPSALRRHGGPDCTHGFSFTCISLSSYVAAVNIGKAIPDGGVACLSFHRTVILFQT